MITPEYFAALATFMLAHLGAAIWFASKINTTVQKLAENLTALTLDQKILATDMKKLTSVDVTVQKLSESLASLATDVKSLASVDIRVAVMDQRVLAVEQRIRDLRDLTIKNIP